jgi:hypothetical protein
MRRRSRKHPWLPVVLPAGLLVAMTMPARAADSAPPPAPATTAPPPPAEEPVTETPEPERAAVAPTPMGRGIPLRTGAPGWQAAIYGFAEFDAMHDSTQSFSESVTNNTIARPDTYAGDNPRTQFTVRNSRFGLDVRAPNVGSIKTSGVIEMDFFGSQASTTENDLFTNSVLRLRQFYMKVETPAIDVLAGQYHDLFAWGGAGFYPNTTAFLAVLGEIYHRNPQFKISKTFGGQAVSFEVAVAAVRPVQRDSSFPDGQAGLRLAFNNYKGAAAPGASRPVSAPLAIGLSAVGRRLSVTDFSATPGNEHTANAGGLAANLFLPIIPAHGPDKEDLGNAVTLTVEAVTGTGIADLSPGLTGGVLFPSLPNPQQFLPVPVYTPNIDPGIATYDASGVLQTINWRSVVGNLQYHFPINGGRRLWLSFTGSVIQSTNSVQVTPVQGKFFVWNKGGYFDANAWISITTPLLLGLAFQGEAQTFGDGISGQNYRVEGSCYFFF